MTTRLVVLSIALILCIIAVSMMSSKELYPMASTRMHPKTRKLLGHTNNTNLDRHAPGQYEARQFENSNIVHHLGVDPNLMQVAGSGALY